MVFNASSSFDPDGLTARYKWDFNGDGIYKKDTLESTVSHITG